ncbi:ATP-dependent nuclease [Rhizobium leguminosarum]|uniref:ATP-dependent nuclease n=1 Tax=Rhizobium leguminosarum TaxID=384 RepID=UPI001C953ADE|nr:AAA family ATPase [Rhizobium leguminosarum]MBY5401046.1 ATP-binding protein [Rhizobium leguminosarum]
MAATIRSIHIENFRSVRSLDADLANLTVFVGKNDCGKSNVLRALNLFFNGYTNPGAEFDFREDYNFFAPVRERRAKEIVVRVEFDIPESYHNTNGQVIVWTKRWREEGLWSEEYVGQRLSTNRRGNEVREPVKIPDKSNVHSLLRKMEFEYVPAVKDSQYFDDLRGRIYGIISEVAARTFHDSSAAFEQAIGDHLTDLTSSITSSLGFSTRLALPRDLYHIFERLDFVSGDKSVSLDNRGDGIKARHIPLILRFMADKKAELQQRGNAPISNIWAYEEPENNLEIASAVQLADEIHALANGGTAQILITTHSPAFYDLGQRESSVALNFITRLTDIEGTTTKADATGIDESLGTLAMLAPRISEMIAQVREQEAARHEAARLAEENCPKIFVEGESDKLILERATRLFFPDIADQVSFATKRHGAGHSYVIDMLSGWRAHHKHHPDRPKAVGILDRDAVGERDEFNKQPDNTKSAKCFCFPNPALLHEPLRRGFKIPVTLESLYPEPIWRDSLARGHLEKRDPVKTYPPQVTAQIIFEEIKAGEVLQEPWDIFVSYQFENDHKVSTARRICAKPDAECSAVLTGFKSTLVDALRFLGFEIDSVAGQGTAQVAGIRSEDAPVS